MAKTLVTGLICKSFMYSRLKAQRKAGEHASAIWDLTLPSKHL